MSISLPLDKAPAGPIIMLLTPYTATETHFVVKGEAQGGLDGNTASRDSIRL